MYEVGIALACRSPEEILLIRDDNEKILFDTSTIPHMTIDFEDEAVVKIREALEDRASERKIIHDVRTTRAIERMAQNDYQNLNALGQIPKDTSGDFVIQVGGKEVLPIPVTMSLYSLLREGLIKTHSIRDKNILTYKLTPLGREIYDHFRRITEEIDESKENDENNV